MCQRGTGVDHVPDVLGDTSRASIVPRALVPPPLAVSNHSTLVTTTAQHAHKQGCLADAGGLWRVWLPGCAAKQVRGSRPT